jgi:MOSC domain-containing protein YiiM
MDDPRFVKRFAAAGRPGPYLTIIKEGDVEQGDSIEVVSQPSHDLTVARVARIYLFERDRLSELLVPDIPASWREWVLSQDPLRA